MRIRPFTYRLSFKEYIAGNSVEDVYRIANLFGYNQKSYSAVQRILAIPIYIAKIKIPEGKQLAQGLHQPIISEYDFYQAQELLTGRNGIVHEAKEDVFLRGVLKDFHGNLMTAGTSRANQASTFGTT